LTSKDTADGRSILFNVFEGLVKPDTDGNLYPATAESYSIEDGGMTYAFKIRPNVKFHNGKTVTAADVKFSLNVAAENGLTGMDKIADVATPDDDTVRITLKELDTYFLPYLTAAIVPENHDARETEPIGTGPFAVESFIGGERIVLKKHGSYWRGDLPYLDRVTVRFFADSAALVAALQSGGIDGAQLDAVHFATLDTSAFSSARLQSASVQTLALNNAAGPLQDVRVRWAVNYAVDADGIIDTAFGGEGIKSGTPVIPGLKAFFNADLTDAYPLDRAKARELLAEAGYENGFPLTITVPSNYEVHLAAARVIVTQLAAVGITAVIKEIDWGAWLTDVYRDREYEATVISLDGSLSPERFLSRYRSDASNNFMNFNSGEYDEVFAEAVSATEDASRARLYKDAQKIISDNAAGVFIQDLVYYAPLRKGFDGVADYPLYVFDFSVIRKR
jgi:peptide/nickel transport system substrate-binding protein